MKRAGSGKSADIPKKKTKPEQEPCEICGEPLQENIVKRHAKCVRNTVTIVSREGEQYTYYRDADKSFHCRNCEFTHAKRDEFKVHVEEMHLNRAPEEPIIEGGGDDDIVTDSGQRSVTPELTVPNDCLEYLQRHGLVIHENLLICIQCKSVVNHTKVRKHFINRHKELETAPSMQQDFNSRVLRFYRTLIADPLHPTQPLERNPYLETRFSYMRCLSCNHCYVSPDSYNQHNCLPEGKRGDAVLYDCQRFVSNTSSSWFPIKKRAPPPFDMRQATPLQLYLNSERDREDEPLDGSQIDEVRILHQFLQKEGWFRIVLDTRLSRKALMDYAHVTPKDPTLVKLGNLIYTFLLRVQDSTPNNTLRRMIGIRPATEHEVTMQRHHFNVSKPTLKKYARTLVGVLQLVRRTKDAGYPFPVHASLVKETEILFTKIHQSSESSLRASFDLDDNSSLGGLVLDEDGEPAEDYSHPDQDEETESSGGANECPLQKILFGILKKLYTLVPRSSHEATMHSPIMQYILLSSLRSEGAWGTITSVTQKIAGAAFVGRVTFAHLITELSTRESITTHDAFDTFKQYLLERSDAIMPNLYLLHRGLASISSAEQSGTILSSPSWDSDAVTIAERNLYFHEIGGMVEALEEEIESDLQGLLFDSNVHMEPFEGQIFDEPRKTTPRYCFVDDERNPWHKNKPLLHHILETPSLFRHFASLTPDGKGIDWHTGRISEWMKSAFQLQEKLMIAIVLTYGEPARSTELVTTLLRNYPGGSIRNFFTAFGTFFLRGSYNKTSFFTGKDKVMARAPLPSISRLFVQFLVYVRPLFSAWQRIIRPKMHHNSVYYLFCGLWRPLTSIDLSKALVRFTVKYLEVCIPPSLHRQIMAFITSRYRRAFPAGIVSTGTDEQLGHSQKMDRKHYGLDASIPGQMDHESLVLSLEVSGVFHRILCANTELLRLIASQQRNVQELAHELEAIRNPSDVTSTPSTNVHPPPPLNPQHIAKAVSHHLAPILTQQIKERIERANAAIVHLFAPERVTSETTHILPSTIVNVHPSAIARLGEIFPGSENHGFSNVQQAQATQLAIEKERSFLLITPTGSGKTLPALIASKYHDAGQTTVWVLPLRSLQEQIAKHCASHGLSVGVYDIGLTPANTPKNLIVSVEKTEKEEFREYLHALCSADKLARIVLDEAHLILTHKSFRPVMDTLNWLGQKSIQIVLLTATLPVNLVGRLVGDLSLCAPITLRSTTERPNISINVTSVDSDTAVHNAVVSTYQKVQANTVKGRTLIFCRTVADARGYGTTLGIPHVDAGMDLDEVESILTRFRSGETLALACTSFLGVGLDVPEVTHVIHAGLPWNLLSYAQEAGRAGRDSSLPKVWSHVIFNRNDLAKLDDDDFGSQAMKDFLMDCKTCRRIVPWTFLDGAALPCPMITPTTHLCDVCEAQSHSSLAPISLEQPVVLKSLPKGPCPPVLPPLPSTSKAIPAMAARVSQLQVGGQPILLSSIAYRAVAKFGKYFAVHCALCHYHGENDGHKFSDCPKVDHHAYSTWYTTIRRRQPEGHCFSCGIPKDIQYSLVNGARAYLHEWMVEGQAQCQFYDAFLPFIHIRNINQSLRESLVDFFRGIRPETDLDALITAAPPAADQRGTPPSTLVILIEKLSKRFG
ncbi:P-loop containing nucleoside triphosphate hydrolase protein [Coprinellus micaceus]|uniref:DNA 3'-5' helicase n=1 Tax=Coprinellus micaceus TaxID=71717 RepID=A0A4Y7SF56_COPMI|nr:P-loop containing nucleoside triphosphate hydrolase protein [Coprinellus micaceus]